MYSTWKYIVDLNNIPYRCCHNLSFRVILFQSYEEEIVEKYYRVYVVLPHLESLDSSRLRVTIFVEHNPFGVINSIIEVDVKYIMLFEKCSNECFIQFCSHKWTSKIRYNFILTSSILSEL